MTRRNGFSLLEFLVVLAIAGLLVLQTMSILLPCARRARETSRSSTAAGTENTVAVEPTPETPTVEDMEGAAEESAEEHDIYDRVVALAEDTHLAIRIRRKLVLDSGGSMDVRLWSDTDAQAAGVQIDGKVVYEQIDDEIRTYLGMGTWEHLLDEIERKVAHDREEGFRAEREKRFGPLPGWRDDG